MTLPAGQTSTTCTAAAGLLNSARIHPGLGRASHQRRV